MARKKSPAKKAKKKAPAKKASKKAAPKKVKAKKPAPKKAKKPAAKKPAVKAAPAPEAVEPKVEPLEGSLTDVTINSSAMSAEEVKDEFEKQAPQAPEQEADTKEAPDTRGVDPDKKVWSAGRVFDPKTGWLAHPAFIAKLHKELGIAD